MSKGNLPEVFLDTDVAFDIISKRDPHFEHSSTLLHMVADGRISILISESSIANLIYLAFDIYKLQDARDRLSDFISACEVISGGKNIILDALNSAFKDKEDAVQYFTARHFGADYFVTRNVKDYKEASKLLPVLTPELFNTSFSKNAE